MLIPQPPRPKNDLRTQLLDSILDSALSGLEAGEERRADYALRSAWDDHHEHVRRALSAAFGPMPCGEAGGPLRDRVVSSHRTRHCTVENVLFESFPGWEVNATLFIPEGAGPHPAVVIPVGHSGKQFENYQIPAQAFASLGFLAVLFDPPGQASEKQRGNDHFRDGVRSFLLGLTPNRYFVLDALRCIDYLETRSDADTRNGVAMSGVSGGGITTLYASLFDSRITCFGPSCCLNRFADHPVGDVYSACPEQFWLRRMKQGIDNVDIAIASAPKPMLYMAGKHDEVFQIEPSRRLADELGGGYAERGAGGRFDFFEDECGHAYTLAQTSRFAQWARRWMLGEQEPSLPSLDRSDFEMLDYETLKCHPSQETTMFTITRDLGKGLAEARAAARRGPEGHAGFHGGPLPGAAKAVGTPAVLESWREGNRSRLWSQAVSEAVCRVESLDVPMTVLSPWEPVRSAVAVVYIDADGRSAALESGGPAFRIGRVVDRDPSLAYPELYVPDLPGFGDSRPMVTPYQAASWGSMDRTVTYFSYGNGDSVLGLAARAAATIVDGVAGRAGKAPSSVILCGRGLGGVIALLAAAVSKTECSVCIADALASFQDLLEAEYYRWRSMAFMADALNHFDLPELAVALGESGRQLLVLNPLDGRREPLDAEQASTLFGDVDVKVGLDSRGVDAEMLAFFEHLAGVGR